MNFRYDINGLRAIAVIAVVLFHFNPVWAPGGFAGVDVFFVISGFLMTGIIFRGLENEKFNLFKFYVARANRIIPALAVLCLVLLAFGWFYLTPLDYRALGKHIASSMGFLSNVIYWSESGYFDVASHEKWLLHTWSLSVEWQFYILYPIVLVLLKKIFSLESLKRLVVIGTVLGFILSIIVTMKLPDSAYYLLPTRAWEMMIGGVAFLYPWNFTESRKKIAELTGFILILASYIFVSSAIPWPGHSALLPVLGAYLMIVSNQQSSLITNNVIFQCLGKWSYSIYLWHWPIVVYGYYFEIQNWAAYGLTLSLILGFVSFKLVESLKFKSFSSWFDLLKIKPIYMALFITVLGSCVFVGNGVVSRLHTGIEFEDLSVNMLFKVNGTQCHDSPFKCNANYNSDEKIILIGDSHAATLGEVLYDYAVKNEISYTQATIGGCIAIDGVTRFSLTNYVDSSCLNMSKKIDSLLEESEKIYTVIYLTRLPLQLSGERFNNQQGGVETGEGLILKSNDPSVSVENVISNKMNEWAKLGHNLIVIYPIPEVGWNVPRMVQKALLEGRAPDVKTLYSVYENRTKNSFQLLNSVSSKNVSRIYPSNIFCDMESCYSHNDNSIFYSDDDHLSASGSKMLMSHLAQYLP